MNDEKLVRRVIKNDRAAADILVGRYYDEIYRFAYRQSMDSRDVKNTAQDLTQEIFISALKSLSTYNPKKAGFRTWLYQVANSRIIDSRRRFRPDEVQIDETEIYTPSDITIDLHNKELLRKIEEHIGTLPSEIQRIFRLTLHSDMTFAQIAASMDMPEATVKTKFYRMIKKVREEFKDEY
ncbi:MAG: RNA polymerase sigma factor [Oscillospiraceae bacterium]|nr:RNA polymerase sigma factor [Oscillospiraceae bacterium]